jgi:Uma2 family endonuclease
MPADILLLVEITSPGNFRQDRIVKHGDYATAGIPFYLRVDLEKGHESSGRRSSTASIARRRARWTGC